ncbi:MAG: diguanylate cyclase, partial [Eubacteriaceae bacterium]|nr:diguanylate cyclase [Eubacteriaceae bacterium]
LTGLYNRETFFEKTAEMVRQKEAGYYIMACFDIDNFKVINDQYGTAKGDEVLKAIGEIFKEGFRDAGGICCRVTADNFAVLYPASFKDSEEIAEIRRKAGNFEGLLNNVSYSIGRYLVDDKSLSASAMYDRATLAQATVKGRYDTYFAEYDELMRADLIKEQRIVDEMGRALEEKQFVLYLQPQYNHTTGSMIGAEALVRWLHPESGLVPPGDFIPIFEKNGFIYELDKFVWEQGCRYLRKWIDEGRNPLPKDYLRLEITESAFAKDPEQIISQVKRLIDYGFTIEIDDFGSGYSSLNTLKDVPAQILKLDMRFIEGGENTSRGGNILESVVRMSKWLGMSVIAEGVETLSQADYLKSIGCFYIQGYFYARPMPAEEYERLAPTIEKEREMMVLEMVDNLDNNSFWDPKSIDTLIFNSYVGGACIYEYHNGNIELIRATDKYAKVIGSAGMTVEDALKLNWKQHLDEATRLEVKRALERSIATGDEVTGEFTFYDLPDCPHETFLRSTMRVIASVGDRFLVYCTNENITAQRIAERSRNELTEQLSAIMNNMNGGVVAINPLGDGEFGTVFTNAKFYSILGYTKQQFEQEVKNPVQIVHPDDRAMVIRRFSAMAVNRLSTAMEFKALKKDGSIVDLRCNSSVISLKNVGDNVLLSVITDITAAVKAELRNEKMSEQLQLILNNVNGGISASALDEDGKMSYLFMNEQYCAMFGYTKQQFEKELPGGIADIILKEDLENISEKNSDTTSDNVQSEYRVRCRDGSIKWVQSNSSVCRINEISSPIHLAVTTDITSMKQTSKEMEDTDEQLRFLNEMAHGLLSEPNPQRGIEKTLFKLVDYFKGDRTYIFEFDYEAGLGINTYECNAPGIVGVKDSLQNVPISMMEHWIKAFRESDSFAIDDISALPEERSGERDLLLAQGISSLFAVALHAQGKLIGFIGIDNPRIDASRRNRLISIGDYMAVMLTRRDLSEAIANEKRTLDTVLSDIPGGFARIRVMPEGLKTKLVYANDGFCSLVDMKRERIMSIFGEDTLNGIHPDDIQTVQKAYREMKLNKNKFFGEYRLRHGSEGFIKVAVFGRLIKTPSGEEFVNSYYTDISQKANAEQNRRELLDNLPCGAAFYEYDHGKINAVYFNEKYRQLVGREIPLPSASRVENSVHPQDIPVMRRAITEAILAESDISCNLRILYGNTQTDYRPFHVMGGLVERADGSYGVYVTYTPIDENELSITEATPFILAAIMGSSSDLSFAKDVNFNYLCSSKAFAMMAGLKDETEVVGKTDYDLFDKETADKYRGDDIRLLESGQSIVDMVEEIPSEDGIQHYSTTSKFILRDTRGNIIGLYGVGRDITEYRTAFERLKFLTDNIPGGLAIFDVTEKRIKSIYFSDGIYEITGYSREGENALPRGNALNFVYENDLPGLKAQIEKMLKELKPMEFTFRIHRADNTLRWLNLRGKPALTHSEGMTVNCAFFDVTAQMEIQERLRISEEEYRLSMKHSGNVICRYIVSDRSLLMSAEAAAALNLDERIENIPDSMINTGRVSPESVSAYRQFHLSILEGNKTGAANFRIKTITGWKWLKGVFTTTFSDTLKPISAVICLTDITEQMEKEAVFKKWQQSLQEKPLDSYTLFRCNLSTDTDYITAQGKLLNINFDEHNMSFNERSEEYAGQYVHKDDIAQYLALMNSDSLLVNYYRGKRIQSLEYRELTDDEEERWLKLTVELVEYPNSSDVEAYLMYENIDEEKQVELRTRKLAETDGMTGLYNKTKTESLIRAALSRGANRPCTLLIADMDNLKRINDTFGHPQGDRAIRLTAKTLLGQFRKTDIVGRIGGDEFAVFLDGVCDEVIVSRLVKALMEKLSLIELSGQEGDTVKASIGIAPGMTAGTTFETLYSNADKALYEAKRNGKNGFAFYK